MHEEADSATAIEIRKLDVVVVPVLFAERTAMFVGDRGAMLDFRLVDAVSLPSARFQYRVEASFRIRKSGRYRCILRGRETTDSETLHEITSPTVHTFDAVRNALIVWSDLYGPKLRTFSITIELAIDGGLHAT